jgi:hypothetical protein
MPGGRPRLTASEHFRNGTYRRDRHGPLPWEKPQSHPDDVAKDGTGDSVWKHELRLPSPDETLADVWRKAREYRERSGVSLADVMARDRQ